MSTPRLLPAFVAACALALGACAKRTRDIEPALLLRDPFAGAACPALLATRARLSQALIFYGLEQDQISADDRTRTLGVPTPMGTGPEGDNETKIALLKGELVVLEDDVARTCGPNER